MAELTEAQIKKRDEIAEALKADPSFQPQEGRTKEESAFAVATAQVQNNPNGPEPEPKPKKGPVDDFLKANLMENALALRESGEADLEAKGRMLELAVQREDWSKAKDIAKDLAKIAKDSDLPVTAEYFTYVSESIKAGE